MIKTVLYSLVLPLALSVSCQKRTDAEPEIKSSNNNSVLQITTKEATSKNYKTDRSTPAENAQLRSAIAGTLFTKEVMAESQKMIQSIQKQKRTKEMLRLDQLLSLNDEQKAAIHEYYEDQEALQLVAMKRVSSGESIQSITNDPELVKGAKLQTMQSLMKDILTEEQYKTYSEDKQKQKERQRESQAYRELATIQSSLDLSDNQKDAVLQIFYDKNYEKANQEEPIEKTLDDPLNNMITRSKEKNERLLKELSNVLSPDQLELYKVDLDAKVEQIKVAQEMMNKIETPSGAKISVKDVFND